MLRFDDLGLLCLVFGVAGYLDFRLVGFVWFVVELFRWV